MSDYTNTSLKILNDYNVEAMPWHTLEVDYELALTDSAKLSRFGAKIAREIFRRFALEGQPENTTIDGLAIEVRKGALESAAAWIVSRFYEIGESGEHKTLFNTVARNLPHAFNVFFPEGTVKVSKSYKSRTKEYATGARLIDSSDAGVDYFWYIGLALTVEKKAVVDQLERDQVVHTPIDAETGSDQDLTAGRQYSKGEIIAENAGKLGDEDFILALIDMRERNPRAFDAAIASLYRDHLKAQSHRTLIAA